MISVIVTAYNRKRFLPYALSSIIKQTLNSSEYEVIVVKNFVDETSDAIIRRHGFREILCENPNQGIHYALALKECKGDIICPLDDDDIFHPKKLEQIKWFFSNIKGLGYVRNSISTFNGHEPMIDATPRNDNFKDVLIRNIRSSNVSQTLLFPFNSSSIAIKKDVLTEYYDFLSKIETTIDIFMFYAAYMADCSVLFTSKILTYYRIHESNTSQQYDTNQSDFLAKRLGLYRHRVNDWKIIKELCHNTRWEYEADRTILEHELAVDLLEGKSRKNITRSLYRYMLKEFIGIGVDRAQAVYHLKKFIEPSSWVYRGALGLVAPKKIGGIIFRRAWNTIQKNQVAVKK